MTMQYMEVGRIACTDHTEVIVSQAVEDGKEIGLMLKKFVTSERYTGWGKDGFLIPKNQVKNLAMMLKVSKC